MKKCLKCGKVWSDQSIFCGNCGTRLEEEDKEQIREGCEIYINDYKKKEIKIPKKKNRGLLFLIGILIIGIIFGGGFIIYLNYFSNQDKDKNEIFLLTNEGYELLKNIDKYETITVDAEYSGEKDSSMAKFSPDGKYFYYISNYDSDSCSGELYRCEYKKLNKNSKYNGKYIQLIDCDTTISFYPLNDGKVIFKDSMSDLYYYNGEELQLIDKNIYNFYCSDDQTRVVYEQQNYGQISTLYGVELNDISNKKILAEEYSTLLQDTIYSFENIFYYKLSEEGTELYVTGFGREPEKLGKVLPNSQLQLSNINEICYVSDSNQIYDAEDIVMDTSGRSELIEEFQQDISESDSAGKMQKISICKSGKSELVSERVLECKFYGDALFYVALDDWKAVDIAECQDESQVEEKLDKSIYENCFYLFSTKTGVKVQLSPEVAEALEDIGDSYICLNDSDLLISYNDYIWGGEVHDGKIEQLISIKSNGYLIGGTDDAIYYVGEPHASEGEDFRDLFVYREGKSKCILENANYGVFELFLDGKILGFSDSSENEGTNLILVERNGENHVIGNGISKYVRCDEHTIFYIIDQDLWIYQEGESKKIFSGLHDIWSLENMEIDQMFSIGY